MKEKDRKEMSFYKRIERKTRLPVARDELDINGSICNRDISQTRENSPRLKSRITRRYWTSGSHKRSNEKKDSKDEHLPFIFPSCSQTLAHLQWWREQKKKVIREHGKINRKDRFDYKTLQSQEILQRLRVDVEIEAEIEQFKDLDKSIAITDIDPQYFIELSNKPVKEKFSLEQYVRYMRDTLKIKLLIGQEKDDCIRIDQQFNQESHRLQKIQHCTQQYVNSFEEFLSRDHDKSIDMLEKAVQAAKLTEEISVRRNKLSKQYGQSRLDVYFWEENWRMIKMCQIFLYQISPTAWRIKHDWLYPSESESESESKKDVVSSSIDLKDLFESHKTVPDEDVSLEDLIELFERNVADAGPVAAAELYFEDPFDLIRVFHTMEMQNLNALIHLESLIGPLANITTTISVTEIRIEREIGEIASTIQDLQNSIAETEDRATNLEEYANYLLQGVFRRLVCSERVLYLRVFVEDAYENCVGPNDANLDSFSMMKWIERNYEELNLQLDNLPCRVVRTCEIEGFRQERKDIREAEDAARKFELMHRLLGELKRIVEVPAKKKRLLIRRSTPISRKVKALSPPLRRTDEEAQYFIFFTDYCKRNAFRMYYSKLPGDFNLSAFQEKRNDIQVGQELKLMSGDLLSSN